MTKTTPADKTGSGRRRHLIRTADRLDFKFTSLKITESDEKPLPTGAASRESGRAATLVVALSATLPPGPCMVAWQALAADGRKTSGTPRFTVGP